MQRANRARDPANFSGRSEKKLHASSMRNAGPSGISGRAALAQALLRLYQKRKWSNASFDDASRRKPFRYVIGSWREQRFHPEQVEVMLRKDQTLMKCSKKVASQQVGTLEDDLFEVARSIQRLLIEGSQTVWAEDDGSVHSGSLDASRELPIHWIAGTFHMGLPLTCIVDDLRALLDERSLDWAIEPRQENTQDVCIHAVL